MVFLARIDGPNTCANRQLQFLLGWSGRLIKMLSYELCLFLLLIFH